MLSTSDNPRTQREAASLATTSSQLRQGGHEHTGIDYVLAMGLLAARGRAEALPILRLHSMATGPDFELAYLYVLGLAGKLKARKHWSASYTAVCHIARTALALHVCATCPHCNGLKFKVVPGTPNLSTTLCPHCRGDGRRQIPAKFRDEIGQVLVAMEALDDTTEAEIWRVLQ